jgi:hypothetical protein
MGQAESALNPTPQKTYSIIYTVGLGGGGVNKLNTRVRQKSSISGFGSYLIQHTALQAHKRRRIGLSCFGKQSLFREPNETNTPHEQNAVN